MTSSYEDYDRNYNEHLNRVRRFLAGTRSRSTLSECERLLLEAQQCATAMQGLAEVEGNSLRVQEAKMRMERDLGPLTKEVKRALNQISREELFHHTPGGPPGGVSGSVSGGSYAAPQQGGAGGGDFESLIRSSDDMLRDSLALCADSEQIGTSTLLQMGRQREQLETTGSHIEATMNATHRAGLILRDMSQKAFRSKMVLKGIIATLLLIDLYLIYRKLFVHN